jgi:hypothetical protein
MVIEFREAGEDDDNFGLIPFELSPREPLPDRLPWPGAILLICSVTATLWFGIFSMVGWLLRQA